MRWSRATPRSKPLPSAYADAVASSSRCSRRPYDYYNQEDYKDDKMAKGRALHPRLIAAWNAFASADKALRTGVETINDRRAAGAARRDRDQPRAARRAITSRR